MHLSFASKKMPAIRSAGLSPATGQFSYELVGMTRKVGIEAWNEAWYEITSSLVFRMNQAILEHSCAKR
jgi:hypothetical protein